MPTMTKPEKTGTFEPCPEGMQQAILIDIVDCGWIHDIFKGEDKGWRPYVKFVFASEKTREEDGKPFLIFDQKLAWTFNEKSKLYARLAAMLGKNELESMLEAGADIETLLGRNFLINVEHVTGKEDKIWANVGTIGPLMASMQPLPYPDTCDRAQNREGYLQPVPSAYDPKDTAMRIINSQPNAGGAAEYNKPATPPPTNIFPPAPQNEIDDAIEKTCGILGVKAGLKKLDEWAKLASHGARDIHTVTASEMAFIRTQMRTVQPKDAAIAQALANDDDDSDPFADESEPGHRPEAVPQKVAA